MLSPEIQICTNWKLFPKLLSHQEAREFSRDKYDFPENDNSSLFAVKKKGQNWCMDESHILGFKLIRIILPICKGSDSNRDSLNHFLEIVQSKSI